jgi:HlyD family secretion protein
LAKLRDQTARVLDGLQQSISTVWRAEAANISPTARRATSSVTGGRRTPQLRSEAFSEVISAPPPFLVRSGLIITAIALLTLVAVASIVPYPSIVGGRAQIVSSQLPVTLLSRGNGKLALLAVKEGDLVKRDDLLAVIDDGSDVRQMLQLQRWLSNVPANLTEGEALQALPPVAPRKLGAAAAPLIAMTQALTNLQAYRASTETTDQVAQLRQVVATYRQLVEQFRDKESAADASLKAEQRMQTGRETLVAKGFATNAYLDKFEAGHQSQRDRVAEARIASARNLAQIASTEREISAILAAHRDRDAELVARLSGALRDLRGAVQEWEHVNVIRAPQAGRARLFGLWSESQNIKSGDTFAIVEPVASAPTAFAFVPAAGFGKVRLGQRVTIRLDAYPRVEFGLLEARVAAISAVAIDGKYRVLLDLPNGLLLSSGRSVQFAQNMDGDARIEVNGLRLIQQMFAQLLAMTE